MPASRSTFTPVTYPAFFRAPTADAQEKDPSTMTGRYPEVNLMAGTVSLVIAVSGYALKAAIAESVSYADHVQRTRS